VDNQVVFATKILKNYGNTVPVYDGGTLPSGRAGSTVVDLTTPYKYKILRPGR
jgi:tRNA A37 threonylcarbamoyladenosine synthetase subunit TsaC/SUA5/YrdC